MANDQTYMIAQVKMFVHLDHAKAAIAKASEVMKDHVWEGWGAKGLHDWEQVTLQANKAIAKMEGRFQ